MCIEEEMTEKNPKLYLNMNILLPCSTAFPTMVFTLTRLLYNLSYLQHCINNLQSHIYTWKHTFSLQIYINLLLLHDESLFLQLKYQKCLHSTFNDRGHML